jgi:hypothetical protein
MQQVIARLERLRPKTPEVRKCLHSLIRYYRSNAARMRYDEYLRLGYGIGSGAVESAHKQLVHARLRQAGMRWSEVGARRRIIKGRPFEVGFECEAELYRKEHPYER